MSSGPDVPAAIDSIATILDRRKIPHAFGGALAQNYWGVVRATQDVDVLAMIPALRFQEVVDDLEGAGFRSRDSSGRDRSVTVAEAREAIRSTGLFAVWLDNVKVELFSPILPLQHRILERAVAMPWRDRTIPVTTAEDLIVLKMVFHRDKDMRDIRAMLAASGGGLDRGYLLAQAAGVLEPHRLTELRQLLDAS